MNEPQLIYRWQLAEGLAQRLGMTIGCNSSSFSVQGTKESNSFKSFYSADNINELLGFLRGVEEAKRVLEIT